MNLKRIVAWVGIVTLVGLYIAALVGGLTGNNVFFSIALYSTFVIPAAVFVLEMLLRWIQKNREREEAIVKEALEKEEQNTKSEEP